MPASKNKIKRAKKVEVTTTTELLSAANKLKKDNLDASPLNYKELTDISLHSANKTSSNDDILDLFPDIRLAMEIVVSSIISPNEMLDPSLNYRIKEDLLPLNISSIITTRIKDYIKEEYDLQDKLFTIIKESLYTKGAYVELIIPSATVYDMYTRKNGFTNKILSAGLEDVVSSINRSRESKLDFITKTTYNKSLVVSSNLELLTVSEGYEDRVDEYNAEAISNSYVAGYESTPTATSGILSFYDTGTSNDVPILKKIPAESVIPIISNDDPSKHYGYFIILDHTGKAVLSDEKSLGATIMDNMTQKKQNSIITRAKNLLKEQETVVPTMSNLDDVRNEIIINNLKLSVDTTNFKGFARINTDGREDLINIMVDRTLRQASTNVVFVPKNLLAYYAYEYRSNGTGESILEKISVLASMKAMGLFSSLLAHVKSNIPLTKVDVVIDEDNPDYEKTMEKVVSEVMNNRQLGLPVGVMKTTDIVDWVHSMGISFNFEHPGLPNTKVEVSETKVDIDPVDSDLIEDIDKQLIRTLGITPEILDNSYSADFATAIVTNNILLARRISNYQTTYNKLITSHIYKIISVDGVIREDIINKLLSNIKPIRRYLKKVVIADDEKKKFDRTKDKDLANYLYKVIIKNLDIKLPEPYVKEADNLSELFSDYQDNLEDFLDTIITDDVLPDELVGEFSDKMDVMRNLIKAIMTKRWVAESGYMPEVMKMFTLGRDGKPILNILEEYKNHVGLLEATLMPFIKEMGKIKDRIDDKLDRIENPEEEEEDIDEDTDDELDNDTDDDTIDEGDDDGDGIDDGDDEEIVEDGEEPEVDEEEEEPEIDEDGQEPEADV